MTQGFSSADWDAVPDVHPDGRTVLPHPSVSPGGMGWHEYFAKLRAARVAPEVEDSDDDGAAIYKGHEAGRIVREAEEFDDPISPLAAFVKLGHKNGWEIKALSHAFSEHRGKPVQTGERAGQMNPDYSVELQWLHLRKEGHRQVSVSYTIINGEARGNYTLRLYGGERKSDAEIKAIIKGDGDG